MKPQPIKGKLPILIALLILVMSSMWLLGRCSRSNENSIVQKYARPGDDTISVAIELSPTCYTFSGDSAKGFDYEMLQAIAAKHNIPIVYQPFAPINYALDGLRSGDFDLVVANVPASADLQEEFSLTNNIFVDNQVLVRHNADSVTTFDERPILLQLLGDTVWIANSSPFRERLSNLSQELGDTIFVVNEHDYTSEHLVMLTALGEIKQAVVNKSIAKRMSKDYPELDISTSISLAQFQPWIVNKNKQELLDSLNIWIEEFKNSPEYDSLVEKYFN